MMQFLIFSCLILIPQLDARGLRVRRDINVPDNVCQDMWNKAVNNLIIGTDMNVKQNNIPDLFTFKQNGKTKLAKAVFTKFGALLSSYLPGSGDNDVARCQKQHAFLSEILVAGGPVDAAYQWLKSNGRTTAASLKDFANDLAIAWFQKYNKNGKGLFSGFEHVFVGELRGNSVSGFHNWYQLYLLKDKPNGITVTSVNKWDATAPPLMELAFTWRNAKKLRSGFFVGTSPAFEMALYSACFIGAGQATSQKCKCKINNKLITIQIVLKNMQVITTYPSS